MISRRGVITGLVSLVAAPAVVRAASLMPVKTIQVYPLTWQGVEFDDLIDPTMVKLFEQRMEEAYRLTLQAFTSNLYGPTVGTDSGLADLVAAERRYHNLGALIRRD